jgi:hypothetical protein
MAGSLMKNLLWLIENNAPEWRKRGVARAMLGRIIMNLPVNDDSHELVKVLDSIQ